MRLVTSDSDYRGTHLPPARRRPGTGHYLSLMKLFLSWSKPRSRRLAQLLHRWLPDVIHRIEPWISTDDIDKGQAWMLELANQLNATSQGIVCVTRENFREPWLNFEAGALANSTSVSRVRPVLLDIGPADLGGPLAQFQATIASSKEDMLRLVQSLNAGCGGTLDEGRLARAFNRAWNEFATELAEVEGWPPAKAPSRSRSAEDKVDEILARLRAMERKIAGGPVYPEVIRAPDYRIATVDLTDIDESLGLVQIAVDATTTVSDFLDHLYVEYLHGHIPAYTYGTAWALQANAHPRRTYRDLGSYWAKNHGQGRDERKLAIAGIVIDGLLRAVRLQRSEDVEAQTGEVRADRQSKD